MNDDNINYIEVSVFDGHVESTGLLTHYGMKSGRIRLITIPELDNELFDLNFFTITRIVVDKADKTTHIEEQYIFKKDEDDQNMAKVVIVNQLKLLEAEGRTTVSGFITKGTFVNIPEKYKKGSENISAAKIVSQQRTESLGGTFGTKNTTTTGKKSVYNQQNINYAKRNVKTVIAIPRTSKLPSKAFLKKMRAMVKAVSEDTFAQKLPYTKGDKIKQPYQHNQMEEDMHTMYDNMGYNGHFGAYD